MRVFFAIEFDENIKSYFYEIQEKVRPYCLAGNFTLKENFHLTLRFIGEQSSEQIHKLKAVLTDTAQASSFELRPEKLGSFRKGNRSIIWIGLEKSPQLQQLYANLEKVLADNGYQKEERSYSPHITLAREVKIEDFGSLPGKVHIENPIIKVKSISLMESKRINNKLCYIPLEKIELPY